MASQRALASLCLALWATLAGCGGGGGTTPTTVPGGDVSIESQQATITVDPQGFLTGLVLKSSGTDIAPAIPQPILELVTAAGTFAVESVELEQGTLIATFDGGNASARISVTEAQGHVLFRVAAVDPVDVKALRLFVTVKRLDEIDPRNSRPRGRLRFQATSRSGSAA